MIPPAPLEELRRILPLLPAAICVLDRDAHYLATSPRYARLCGTGPDALAGQPMMNFCSPDLVGKARRDFDTLDSGENIVDHQIVFRDRTFLVSVDPIYGSNDRDVVAISVVLTSTSTIQNMAVARMIADDAPSSAPRRTEELRQPSSRARARDGFARRSLPLGSRIPLCALIQTLAVAEHLNFRHAASALGTSQSSVSARVKALENELGILLFERNTRGVRLTEPGKLFVDQVTAGIDQLDHAVKIAGMAATGERGRLRIGVHGLITGGFLDHLLTRYRAAYPAIAVEMTEGSACDAVMQLRANRLDIAFVVGKVDLPDCHSRPIWTEPLVAALPENHPLAGQSGVTWPDLNDETFLVRHTGTGPQVHDHIVLRFAGRWPPPTIQRFDVERGTLLAMVAQGFGITLLGAASQIFPTAGVVLLPITDEPAPVVFSAVWSPHNRSALLRNLLTLAQEMGRSPQ